MIDHTGINVRDLDCAKNFYRAALAPLGYGILKDFPNAAGFGAPRPDGGGDPGGDFWISEGTPYEPRSHIAFSAQTRHDVEAFHQAALAAGGTDNGGPGIRAHYHANYYAAFILDPDGYNIEAVCHREI